MSQQRSLEQERAAAAWECVRQVAGRGSKFADGYGRLARSAPADIQANGLGQTLAFLRAKGSKDGQPKPNDPHWQLQEDLSQWVMKRLQCTHGKELLGWIMAEGTSTDDYRRATAEAVAFLVWLKRFAEAELGEGGGKP